MRTSFIATTLAIASGIALVGCTTWMDSDKPFQVSDSSLNWTEALYSTTNTTTVVRLSILGNGNIVLCRGTSSRLLDAFAVDIENESWSDFERDEINLARKDVQQIHQLLINRGALKKNKKLPPGTVTLVQMHGKIDDKVFATVTADPRLVQIIESVIALFPPPSPPAKKP